MAGFCLASEMGPSPSEREGYESLIRSQAEQLQEARNAAPSGGMSPQERQALVQLLSDQSRKIKDLEKALKDVQDDIAEIREHFPALVVETKKRISILEERRKPQKTDANLQHINILASELLTKAKAGQKGITYAEAAKILKLDKSRICQLRSLIASDSRFDISWHPKKKNTKVICLKNYK